MSERILFKDYLMEQIRHRYSRVGMISDDNAFIHQIFDEDVQFKDFVFLNENLKLLKGDIGEYNKYLPTYLTTETFWKIMKKGLPESLKRIKKISQPKVKKLIDTIFGKKLKLCVVGYGGAMSNILYNFSIIAEQHRAPLFEEIVAYEPEKWAFTNILRIGKPILHKGFSRFENLTGDNTVFKLKTIDVEERIVNDFLESRIEYLDQESAKELRDQGYIFIGAPDLKTRKVLHEIGAQFLMIGHANDQIRITKNPVLGNGLVQETYGSIDIGILLMNFWFATFHLLDIFANQDIKDITDDTELFKFKFLENFSDQECAEIKKEFEEELKERI
jgi:hypothetical protein